MNKLYINNSILKSINHINENEKGKDYCRAREVMKVLEYS